MTKTKLAAEKNILYYYCNNHSTTRLSTDNKKHSICNSKIAYDKSNKQYILLEEHSNQCLNIIKPVDEIMISSSNLINNYSNFKAELIKQLERHPFQNYSTFCKTATNLYNKDSYEFSLTPNTFKNIYYPWKNNSLLFTKFSVFGNDKTNLKEQFLRDYTYTYYYDDKGKKLKKHEHFIFISNFQIRKICTSKHLYIDGTFIKPKGFTELIIILYHDEELNIRAPGCYILLNNKSEIVYTKVFKKFRKIISIENSREFVLQTYITDFETALLNSLKKIFLNTRRVGCYYHYVKNIRQYDKNII